MTLALEPRDLKALAIAANAATWQQLSPTTFRVPSQTHPGQSYLVTPQMCSCPAFERHPERPCKHSVGVAIYVALKGTEA
jgi:predicted nucleic acid-binding Zn finger protein